MMEVSLTRHFAKCLGWEGTEEDQRPVLGQCNIAHLMERVINDVFANIEMKDLVL